MKRNFPHLELPIPPGRRDEWAAEAAQIPSSDTPTQCERFFVVRLGGEWFGLPAEILANTQPDVIPRKLPHSRPFIEGMVNADGRVIVCLAIEKILGVLPATGGVDAPRLLILHGQKWNCAFRVRQVLGLEEIDMAGLQPLAAGAGEILRQGARGVVLHHGRAVVCLGAEGFLGKLLEAVR